MDILDKMVCKKVAKVFEASRYNVILFPEYWLKSDIDQQLINKEPALLSQSPLYILECFSDETGNKIPYTKENIEKEVLFWFGYIITYIQLEYNISGAELWKKYDLVDALRHYDVLHTVSSKTAANMIIKDYNKLDNALLKTSKCMGKKDDSASY